MPEVSASVVVNIYGKNYTFALGPGQTVEHIQEIAQLVDDRMRQAYEAHRLPAPLQIAILAGLNLVDELFKLQSDYRTAESELDQRASRLAASLGRLFEQTEATPLDSQQR